MVRRPHTVDSVAAGWGRVTLTNSHTVAGDRQASKPCVGMPQEGAWRGPSAFVVEARSAEAASTCETGRRPEEHQHGSGRRHEGDARPLLAFDLQICLPVIGD
jgi:hypothetical protein